VTAAIVVDVNRRYIRANLIRLFVDALAQHSARFDRWLITRHDLNPDWTTFFTGLLGCILYGSPPPMVIVSSAAA
jgi:hypothetical protein